MNIFAVVMFSNMYCSYRIRLPTEKEQEMMVSKAVKKMRFYESTLLSAYKVFFFNLERTVKNGD